jgi:CheY-like chemotaxis protein
MQSARVFLVEDNPLHKRFANANLKKAGHEVVLEATSLEEAQRIIKSGQLQEKGVNVAVVDGYFLETAGGREIFAGPIVAETIREKDSTIKIVSHSSLPLDMMNIQYGDVHAWKRDEKALETAITSL